MSGPHEIAPRRARRAGPALPPAWRNWGSRAAFIAKSEFPQNYSMARKAVRATGKDCLKFFEALSFTGARTGGGQRLGRWPGGVGLESGRCGVGVHAPDAAVLEVFQQSAVLLQPHFA